MVTLFAFRIHMLNPWRSGAPIPSISCSDIAPSIPLKESALLKKLERWGEELAKRHDALECRTLAIWGGILWRSNPLTLREIRVVDQICDLPSSPKGAIKIHEICHNPCVAIRKIVFAL